MVVVVNRLTEACCMIDQLNEIKDAMKLCKEDEKERMKYSEKQLLNKVGGYIRTTLVSQFNEILPLIAPVFVHVKVYAYSSQMQDGYSR